MDQEHSITKHVKGKHLNYTERVSIKVFQKVVTHYDKLAVSF